MIVSVGDEAGFPFTHCLTELLDKLLSGTTAQIHDPS
jgi:hypothetical protein